MDDDERSVVGFLGLWDSGIVDDFTSAVLRNRVQGVTARPGPKREDGPRALGCGPIHGALRCLWYKARAYS